MPRPANAHPSPLAPPLSAALSKALTSVNSLLDSDDPKVVLRAVAELSKLLAVCGRNGWTEQQPPPQPMPGVSVAPPVSVAATKPERPLAPRPAAAFNATPVSPSTLPDPSLSARPAPFDGPRLTSFL